MNKIVLTLFAIVTVTMLANVQPAFAHVVIRDETNSVGAVLHITPDDDPVAGDKANLYFSIENQSLVRSNVTIAITDEATGQIANVEASMNSSSVSAEYVFPSRGVYSINLKVSGVENYNFSYTQRVTKGTGSSSLPEQEYPLAKATLLFSGMALIFTVIVLINRRKDIFSQSTF